MLNFSRNNCCLPAVQVEHNVDPFFIQTEIYDHNNKYIESCDAKLKMP